MKHARWISFCILALLAGLVTSAEAATPAAGDTAPQFSLADQNAHRHSLADYAGQWLVLYFYPKDDTPGCTQEACNFRDEWARLQQMGVTVLGISLDDISSHKAFAEKYHLPFPLLADLDGATAKAYGASPLLSRWAKRYTFIIDPEGVVAKAYLKVDPEHHANDPLRLLLVTP